jgi:hypothetical protein
LGIRILQDRPISHRKLASRKNGNEDKDDDHTTKKWGEGLPPFFHEEDDDELEAELRAIATEYYQQEAIAKVFAA